MVWESALVFVPHFADCLLVRRCFCRAVLCSADFVVGHLVGSKDLVVVDSKNLAVADSRATIPFLALLASF